MEPGARVFHTPSGKYPPVALIMGVLGILVAAPILGTGYAIDLAVL